MTERARDDDNAFARDLSDFSSMPNGASARARYLELAKKYHPDGRGEAAGEMLHERMAAINAAFERIRRVAQDGAQLARPCATRPFDFHQFAGLFARYAETSRLFHRAKEELHESFAKTARSLAMEIGKRDRAAGEALEFLSAKENIVATNFSLFLKALKFYANNYIYAHEPVNVFEWERLGEDALADYAASCPKGERSEKVRESTKALAVSLKRINREFKASI
ncbi:MAG: J domain-containing protein [Treponema sp.]|nr:J domain-containing protein [Treponema sp.]